MPLLGKKCFKPSPLPKDLKSEEEIFVIKETNEVFRSYDEYVNRIILYGFQVWSCQLTGKTNLKYGEAVACEEQALKKLEGFPKHYEKPVLQIIHHSSSGLQTLAQLCYKHLEKEHVENEPVEFCTSGKWYKGRISRVHHGSVASDASENNTATFYDIKCDVTSDCIKDVQSGDIKRLKKLPSVEMLKSFIRANTENPWTNDNSPWQVKSELVKKYSLVDKLQDFSLVVNKKTTPTSTAGAKSTEKQRKRLLDESARHGKSKVNKIDPSQRKLDSFRKSTGNTSKITDKIIEMSKPSSGKLSQNSFKKCTPVKQDLVEICSSPNKDDDKTPSGELRGTPVKCRLVLTPIKSPRRLGTVKSPACKQSKGGSKTSINFVTVEDNTDDLTIIACKSPKTKATPSGKKLKKTPKSEKSKKKGTAELKEKPAKEVKASKMLDLVGNCKEKGLSTTQKKTKAPNINAEDAVQKTAVVDLMDDSENEFVSSPKKLNATVTLKQISAGKMKQTTLFHLTKKPEDEKAVPSSPKIKAKKQKTLSQMFSPAVQHDKPRTLVNVIKKTAQEVSSPSSLNLNLSTPQQDLAEKKWDAHKQRIERQLLKMRQQGIVKGNMKQEDNDLVNLKPLPPAKPVDIPDGITPESYSDIAMLVEFVHTFQDLLLPKETLNISIEYLSEALVSGSDGFPLLSKILVIFLQILLQESSTKGTEMDMQLSEMPVTQQTASEVSRLYLNSKLEMLTAYTEGKQLQEILKSLQHEEWYNLAPEEKLKILVILCHEVLSSDAFDDYVESLLAKATEIRKEKMAKQKEKNDKLREEKEKLKKEKEELQKQKEEDEGKKQLKLDELNKHEEAESSCASSEAVNVNPSPDNSSKTNKPKVTKEFTKEKEEVSDVVKTLRQRREDMANKEEKKLKEEKERLEKEKEEQWNMHLAQCQHTLRLKPIGYDRNNSRYWVFNGAAPGVYVEKGWTNLEHLSKKTEVSNETSAVEDVTMETKENKVALKDDDDVELVEAAKEESKIGVEENKVKELSFPDVPYSWSSYNTVEEVQALLVCLSQRGIRESALKKSLKEKMTWIAEGIKRSSHNYKRPKAETGGWDVFRSLKEELVNTAESLVNGNLAILDDGGLEKYQQTVEQASCISDLASQLEKLLPSVLPQFYQGIFSKDKATSERAKQSWLEEVKKATTVSRLHLLLGILDSTVIWDLSAENVRCKVCRSKAIGQTLILCDDCNLGFHLKCLRPALSEVPDGHWSCPICKPTVRQSSRSSVKSYKEESSSEAEDEKDEASDASLGESEESSSEDESDEHEDYCHTCGEDGNLICCDTCPLVFHKDCHQPPLRHIPRGAWSCWQCRQPKNKKQKGNLRVTTKSKAAKNKVGKGVRRDESSQATSKRKQSRSLSSEESGNRLSTRTRQRRQPIIIEDDSPRGTRRRTRASIEDDDEEQSETNVKSFYGRSSRRTRQQTVSNNDNFKDDDDDSETEEKENRKTSKRKNGNRSKIPVKSARRSTRSHRRVLESSEGSDDEDEDILQPTNQRASRDVAKGGSKQVSSSFDESDESGHDTSKRTRSKRQALSEKYPNKSSKGTVRSNSQGRRGKNTKSQEEDEAHDDNEKVSKNNIGKDGQRAKGDLRKSSPNKDGQKETRNTRRTEENTNEKRRRVNLEMDACEKIVRELLLHENSWPFTEAVNLREVPDYLELVTTPMDLGTIREKLRCLEYPDVESFVADVRLVFSNSEKYNLDTSEVGTAAKNLESYFDRLLKQNFSNLDKKSKVQRKR